MAKNEKKYTLQMQVKPLHLPEGPIGSILLKYGPFGGFLLILMLNIFYGTLQKVYHLPQGLMTLIISLTILPLVIYEFYVGILYVVNKKNHVEMIIGSRWIEFIKSPKDKLKVAVKKISYKFYHVYDKKKKFIGPAVEIFIPKTKEKYIVECKCIDKMIMWNNYEKSTIRIDTGNAVIEDSEFLNLVGFLHISDNLKQYSVKL